MAPDTTDELLILLSGPEVVDHDDHVRILDVEPARPDVREQQDKRVAALTELLEHLSARRHIHQAVHRHVFDIMLVEELGQQLVRGGPSQVKQQLVDWCARDTRPPLGIACRLGPPTVLVVGDHRRSAYLVEVVQHQLACRGDLRRRPLGVGQVSGVRGHLVAFDAAKPLVEQGAADVEIERLRK